MSEIPISSVVKVNISTTPQVPSQKGFGTYMIVGKRSDADSILDYNLGFYSSMDDVGLVFDAVDEEYKSANAYFAQSPSPDSLYIGFRYTVAQYSYLIGSSLVETDIPTWTAITDGSFNTYIDGTQQIVTALDFNAVTDMDDVALVITGGITGAVCTWDATKAKLIIESTATGSTSSILGFNDGGVGTYIGENSGFDINIATEIVGVDAETEVADALDRLNNENNEWYAFGFTKETRENQDVQDSADWAEARVKIFMTTTNNADVKDASITTDIASILNGKALRRTCVLYSSRIDEYPEASWFGRSATINFNASDTTINTKFKQLPIITSEPLVTAQLNAIVGKGCNVFYKIAGVQMTAEGVMSAGVGVWFDVIHGVDWLQNAIETNIFAYLLTQKKVPLTDKGGATLEQQMISALEQGRRNGLIADSGTTIDGEFLAVGYKTSVQPVSEIPVSEKQTRVSPVLYFTAIGSGAINSVVVEGVFEG